MGIELNAGWKPGDPIGYVREKIPDFDVPPYEGERYEALVPDTLDIQERAALAVNGLTSPTDPLADYEMYWIVHFNHNPPVMQHDWNDHCQHKFMEALPLMRIASGSDLNSEVDRAWMGMALHQLGPDGLAYTPVGGRPWAAIGLSSYVPTGENTGVKTFDEMDQYLDTMWCGRLMSAMLLYHKRDGGSVWRESVERLVDALTNVAVDRGHYAYYSPSSLFVLKDSTLDYGRTQPLRAGFTVVWEVLGLAHAYRELGYEPALPHARKLINYLLEEVRYVDEDGRFVPGVPEHPGMTHFHAHTYALLSMLEYGLVAGDDSLVEIARKGYEYGRAKGEVLTGYFPEFFGNEQLEHCELCEVGDMIALGLKLSQAGLGDYWDDVDRWVRNMFAEGQLTPAKVDWLQRYSANQPVSAIDPMFQSTDRVVERNVGSFAGWAKANDWYVGDGPGIMHCCTGNCTRAIYYVWEHMLWHDGNKLAVNLLLNRPSPWADVESHIPYVGQVDVKVKQSVDLSIRIPEWVQPGEVRVQVNEARQRVDWDGRYAVVGEVKPRDVVTMTFPIAERTNIVWIEKEKYALVRKGNDIVAIDPPGRYSPLYQREHYRVDGTRWRRIPRFVSKEHIYW